MIQKIDNATVREAVQQAYERCKNETGGKNADYIPYLANVPSTLFGIAACLPDGEVIAVGDTDYKFGIESVSKVPTAILAMNQYSAQEMLDKIGADEVAKLLVEGCGADEAQARACLELAELTAADGKELSDKFDALCAKHDIASDSDAYVLARQGLDTLAMIVDEAARIRPGSVIADLKIARGLDYYTGSVYETFLDGAAALGSICSGGRYDNLASQGNKKYPGVGLSIGLSRLVSYMLHTAGAHANRVSPASVLVAVWNEADRSASNLIANQLRSRGIAADVAPTAAKLGKQIKYADKLGIPYVWFPADASEEGAQDEVKNIITGDQQPADAQSWEPDTVYAQQTVTVEA